MNMLYNWQNECLEAWLNRDCRGIVSAVTGSGKTKLAVMAAKTLLESLSVRGENLSVRVVVPKTFLLGHWKAAFMREGVAARMEIGLFSGEHKDDIGLPFMLYVLNSARYSLARHVLADIRAGRHVLLIVDECHHLTGEKNMKVLEFLPKLGELKHLYHVLALSATAEGIMRDKRLYAALGGLIYRYGMSEALRDGVVSDFVLLPVSVAFTDDERTEYDELSLRLAKATTAVKKQVPALRELSGAAFFARLEMLAKEKGRVGYAARLALRLSTARREMMHMADNRVACACELVYKAPESGKIILFGERIACAERIYALLEAHFPGQVGLCHSGLGVEAVRAALWRYQHGETRILISCRALDEGLDVPETDIGIVVSSTRGERQRVQRLGRLLRRCGRGLPAKLYYIYLENSSEEVIYLEQDFPFPLVPLRYLEDRRGFWGEEFEALAEAVRKSAATIDTSAYAELQKQLMLCLARGDFVLPEEACASMRDNAGTPPDRNYWTAALLLARARESMYNNSK